MTDQREPKGGGNAPSPKRKRGKNWLRKRSRGGKSWLQRKIASRRYIPAVPR